MHKLGVDGLGFYSYRPESSDFLDAIEYSLLVSFLFFKQCYSSRHHLNVTLCGMLHLIPWTEMLLHLNHLHFKISSHIPLEVGCCLEFRGHVFIYPRFISSFT